MGGHFYDEQTVSSAADGDGAGYASGVLYCDHRTGFLNELTVTPLTGSATVLGVRVYDSLNGTGYYTNQDNRFVVRSVGSATRSVYNERDRWDHFTSHITDSTYKRPQLAVAVYFGNAVAAQSNSFKVTIGGVGIG